MHVISGMIILFSVIIHTYLLCCYYAYYFHSHNFSYYSYYSISSGICILFWFVLFLTLFILFRFILFRICFIPFGSVLEFLDISLCISAIFANSTFCFVLFCQRWGRRSCRLRVAAILLFHTIQLIAGIFRTKAGTYYTYHSHYSWIIHTIRIVFWHYTCHSNYFGYILIVTHCRVSLIRFYHQIGEYSAKLWSRHIR